MAELRKAVPSEIDTLSDLAFRSKAYWGYDNEFMEACREELTLNTEDCDDGLVVITAEDLILGFYQIKGEPPEGELDKFFIDPNHILRGYGSGLLNDALFNARTLGYTLLIVESDPNAKGFYENMGARNIGARPSKSIPVDIYRFIGLGFRKFNIFRTVYKMTRNF